ncbi:MAG: hypothetical protein ACI3X2_11995, partial [Butyricicoccus porcorum]
WDGFVRVIMCNNLLFCYRCFFRLMKGCVQHMKLKRKITSMVASGLLVAMLGSQAFAYNWSGYIGDNKWTSVAGLKTKTTSSSTAPSAKWSGTEDKNKGCKVEVYNEGGTRVAYGTLTYGSSKNLTGSATKGKAYSMSARTTSSTSVGIYNNGTWAP